MAKKKTAVDLALDAAAEAFKSVANQEIEEIQQRMLNVLRVRYFDASKVSLPKGLEAPRLQFRWDEGDGYNRICHYEMVFPLRKHDCRNDEKQNFAVVELGRTKVGSGDRKPWDGPVEAATPFRDGAHMQWDSEAFGGLPMYVISPDGSARVLPPKKSEAA